MFKHSRCTAGRSVTSVVLMTATLCVVLAGCSGGSSRSTGPTTSGPASTTTTSVASKPTLGRPWGSSQQGYGGVEPTTVFNGGDPTGLLTNVQWQSWGGAQAVGQGTSDYVAANQAVADGTQAHATVVAFNLGTCQGEPAYNAVEWYFPEYGQSFNPGVYINICTGAYVGQ